MGPLTGIRIIEMDAIGPVPLACTILADMGADILRIARAGGHAAYADVGGAILHRGRDALELDLKSPADRETLLTLIERADALIEGFRPGVMERLGLGPEPCLERCPSLVYTRMTGWGQTGPLAPRAGHDINYIALTGALGMMGAPNRPPEPPLNLVGDYGGGAMFAALGLVAGVLSARQTGTGQVIDAAMTDGTAMLLSLFVALGQSGGWVPARGANLLDGGAPFYRCYACADGGHLAVGAIEPQFFAALLRGLGLPEDEFRQNDQTTWPEMRDRLAACFAAQPRDHWAALFANSDACVTPVLSVAEAADHPHNAARGTYAVRDGIVQPAPAPRFQRPAPPAAASGRLTADQALTRWHAVSG